jgi:hypothetical protein
MMHGGRLPTGRHQSRILRGVRSAIVICHCIHIGTSQAGMASLVGGGGVEASSSNTSAAGERRGLDDSEMALMSTRQVGLQICEEIEG